VLALAALMLSGALTLVLRERALAARFTRLVDLELVRGLEDEARSFWPVEQRDLAPMATWLVRAEDLLARGAEHRLEREALARRARPLTPADRRLDEGPARATLTTLAMELDGLASFIDKADRRSPPPPPAPEQVRQRAREIEELFSRAPDELSVRLQRQLEELRARMRANEALWRPDLPQLDEFEVRLAQATVALATRTTWRFDDPLDAWRHEALGRLLDEFAALERVTARVRAQHAEVQALTQRAEGEGAQAWRAACAAIAASPCYGGLVLEPLFGFLPLGENPASGLWEFLHVPSGAPPALDARTPGLWRVGEESGIVFVLLPGGRARIGHESDQPSPLHDWPAHWVELEPFLLARHELTVAQAERLGGYPSERVRPLDGRLPLRLDWPRARALLLQHGFELPTEAQWEYAATLGNSAQPELAGRANLFDLARLASRAAEQALVVADVAPFDDGYIELAPVGELLPDGAGFHDLFGNVAEWCLDGFIGRAYSTLPPRPGDGLRSSILPVTEYAARGGSFVDGVGLADPTARSSRAPQDIVATGLRPARRLANH